MDSRYELSLVHSITAWLDSHTWSTALHESLWVWPLVESTHVLTVTLFVGVLLMVDLRLLGVAFKDTPVSVMTGPGVALVDRRFLFDGGDGPAAVLREPRSPGA